MAFIPISGIVPQATENGNQANGMVLKFYEPGTLTPLAVGIDSTGVTQTTEFVLNIEGYTTLSGSEEIPHVDQIYKIALYLNQSDADSNDTGSAVYVIDDINVVLSNENTAGIAQNTANNTIRPLDDIKADTLIQADTGIGLQSKEYVTGSGIGSGVYQKVSVDPGDNLLNPPTGDGNWLKLIFDGELLSSQFGALGNDIDETAIIQTIRDYVAANPETAITFIDGTYSYTVSPNWAIEKSNISFEGDVTFHNTGVGDSLIFDAGAVATIFDFRFGWGNRVNVEGDASSLGGVFIRSCHHCKIAVNVRGCGATSDAFKIEFSVLGEYDFVASTNQAATFTTIPLRGIVLTRRGVGGELTSACTFYNPIIEGVSGDGIVVDRAIKNLFLGGTTEGNGNDNLICTVNSRVNTFQGIDLEVTGSGVGLRDGGQNNSFNDVFNDAETIIEATSINSTIIGGQYDAVTIEALAEGATLTDFSYSSQGGALTDDGTLTTIRNPYFLLGARYFPNNKTLGRNDYTATESYPFAWAVPGSVPGFSARTALPLVGVKIGDNVTASPLTAADSNFIPIPVAECTVDGQIDITFSQLTGVAVSPLAAGSDFVININGVEV